MTFVATAPAPLSAMPADAPRPAASEAANDTALIEALAVAVSVIAPVRAFSVPALLATLTM